MKNIFRFWMAVAIIFGAVSCAKEDISSSLAGGEVEVTFTANLPELGTRAYGDGANANLLRYWVYDASNGQELTALSNEVEGSGTFTFTLPLIKGMTYNFVLWADKDGLYTVNDGIVSVDYENANDNDRDAFYGYVQGFDPLKDTPKFTLIRPFAQLNAATSEKMEDITANLLTLATSKIETKAYTQFNITTGDVVDSSLADVELAATTMPYLTKDENGNPAPNKLPGKETYTYLAMGYVLAPKDGMVADVTFYFNGTKNDADFTVGGDKGLSYGNVPLKQNYRTNILGQLLTKSTEIEVEILPGFGIPDIEDYEEVAPGLCLINGDTYLITSLEGLKNFATFADGVTRSTINFKGKTVELAVDIDLENNPWTPINEFNGTFDGQGHTIKNVKIVAEDKAYAGFFANAQGTIKNLTLENVDIKGHYKTGAIVGNGLCSRIENCHVLNGTIETSPVNKDDGNHAGGITGYLSAENNAWVKDCSVKNVTVIAYRDCGALIGTVNGSNNIAKLEVSGNTVENVTVIANQLDEYNEEKAPNAGVFVGRNIKNVDLADNTATNVVVEVLKFDEYDTLEFQTAAGFDIIAASMSDDGFAGKTIKMAADIDLFKGYMADGDYVTTAPIGDKKNGGNNRVFKGTFDGQGHTIKNLFQNGWALNYEWGVYGSLGLFRELEDATVKNVVLEGAECYVEGGDVSFIAGSATGDCVFEDITIKKSTIATYNNGCGGIIGWSGAGNYTFKNIILESDVVLGGLWGSFDSSIGGIVGQAEPGATYNFENVTINCRIDAYNDCTASYDYYNYRMCGMIIGRCEETTTINGVNYPDLSKYNLSFNNVVVNYGDWMNYHYCEPTPGHNGGRGMRVEPGYAYDGLPADYDHSQCVDNHMYWIPFNQLIGGNQYGVKGLPAVEGVTVNYPESFYREQGYKVEGNTYSIYSGQGFKTIATSVLNDGSKNVTIELANDIDLAGIEWPAVKTAAAFVLDGKGHAIKNLTTSAVEAHGFFSTAMFTSTRKATTIKNLVVENATVTGKGGNNSHGAVLVACNYAALNIEGVTVKGSTVSNCDRSSVLVTYLYFTNATVKDCVVEQCTVDSIGTAGAILGMNNIHNFEATGNTVKNTTISSSEGSNKAGILIGTWQDAGTLTESGNVVENSKAINAGTETNNNIGRHA